MRTAIRKATNLAACAARFWSADSASNIGAGLAFYSAFSLAPLLIIVSTVVGFIVGSSAAYGQIGSQLAALFGPSTAKILLDAMRSSQQTQGLLATLTSIVTLLIGATTVLAALQQALEQIWQSDSRKIAGWMGWVRSRFLSLGFILALGFLLLVSLTITTGLSGVRGRLAHAHPSMVAAIGGFDVLSSLALVSALFAAIFRYMPARRLPWRVVLIGGLVTAVLFDAGRWGVGVYLAHSTQPSAFGAASSFVALLLWLYYSALIFLYGAEFTACLGGLRNTDSPASSPGAIQSGSRATKPAEHMLRGDSKMSTDAENFDLTPPTEAERREITASLSQEERQVLLHHGTEAPFCGVFLDNKTEGVYTCRFCGLPLFRSSAKFDSGTGWPSFFQPFVESHIRRIRDTSYGMARVEEVCARCGGHLGHVFPDGPPPTGERHCLNSVSLSFTQKGQSLPDILGRGPPEGAKAS